MKFKKLKEVDSALRLPPADRLWLTKKRAKAINNLGIAMEKIQRQHRLENAIAIESFKSLILTH